MNLVFLRGKKENIGAVSSPANRLVILLMTLMLKDDGSRLSLTFQDGRQEVLGLLGYSTQRPQFSINLAAFVRWFLPLLLLGLDI